MESQENIIPMPANNQGIQEDEMPLSLSFKAKTLLVRGNGLSLDRASQEANALFAKAFKIFDDLCQRYPTNSIFLVDRASAYEVLGNYDKGLADCDKAIELEEAKAKAKTKIEEEGKVQRKANAHATKGGIYLSQADFEHAYKSLKEALNLVSPEEKVEEKNEKKGKKQEKQKKFSLHSSELTDIFARRFLLAAWSCARELEKQGKYQLAFDKLAYIQKKRTALYHQDFHTPHGIAQLQQRMGKYTKAIQPYKDSIKSLTNERPYIDWHQITVCHLLRGNIPAAINSNHETLTPPDGYRNYIPGRNTQAHILYLQGNAERARDAYHKMLLAENIDASTLTQLVQLYLDQGNLLKADEMYRKYKNHAVELYASPASLLHVRGHWHYTKKDITAALVHFSQAFKIDPTPEHLFFHIMMLVEDNRYAQAQQAFDDFVFLKGNPRVHKLQRAQCEILLGGNPTTIKNNLLHLLESLLEDKSEDKLLPGAPVMIEIRLTLGFLQFLCGEFSDAIKTLEAIKKLSAYPPYLTRMRFGLALACAAQGEKHWEEAREHLAHCEKRNPHYRDIFSGISVQAFNAVLKDSMSIQRLGQLLATHRLRLATRWLTLDVVKQSAFTFHAQAAARDLIERLFQAFLLKKSPFDEEQKIRHVDNALLSRLPKQLNKKLPGKPTFDEFRKHLKPLEETFLRQLLIHPHYADYYYAYGQEASPRRLVSRFYNTWRQAWDTLTATAILNSSFKTLSRLLYSQSSTVLQRDEALLKQTSSSHNVKSMQAKLAHNQEKTSAPKTKFVEMHTDISASTSSINTIVERLDKAQLDDNKQFNTLDVDIDERIGELEDLLRDLCESHEDMAKKWRLELTELQKAHHTLKIHFDEQAQWALQRQGFLVHPNPKIKNFFKIFLSQLSARLQVLSLAQTEMLSLNATEIHRIRGLLSNESSNVNTLKGASRFLEPVIDALLHCLHANPLAGIFSGTLAVFIDKAHDMSAEKNAEDSAHHLLANTPLTPILLEKLASNLAVIVTTCYHEQIQLLSLNAKKGVARFAECGAERILSGLLTRQINATGNFAENVIHYLRTTPFKQGQYHPNYKFFRFRMNSNSHETLAGDKFYEHYTKSILKQPSHLTVDQLYRLAGVCVQTLEGKVHYFSRNKSNYIPKAQAKQSEFTCAKEIGYMLWTHAPKGFTRDRHALMQPIEYMQKRYEPSKQDHNKDAKKIISKEEYQALLEENTHLRKELQHVDALEKRFTCLMQIMYDANKMAKQYEGSPSQLKKRSDIYTHSFLNRIEKKETKPKLLGEKNPMLFSRPSRNSKSEKNTQRADKSHAKEKNHPTQRPSPLDRSTQQQENVFSKENN